MSRKLISVTGVQNIIGYSFRNADTLWLALQAAGSSVGGMDGSRTQAMIGDAVLKLVLIDDLATTGKSRGISCLHITADFSMTYLMTRSYRFYGPADC
jgi:hypothetical protein